ncbi:hypothetical protein FI615_001711 [Enterococcus faecium]|nr:hypothetical protein [Enterococcus faecium]
MSENSCKGSFQEVNINQYCNCTFTIIDSWDEKKYPKTSDVMYVLSNHSGGYVWDGYKWRFISFTGGVTQTPSDWNQNNSNAQDYVKNKPFQKIGKGLEVKDDALCLSIDSEKGLMVYKNQYITTENWDDIQDSGIYYCAGATGENRPVQGTLYGNLIVIKTVGVIIQQFLSNGMFYTRAMIGYPMAWNPWSKLASDASVMHSSGNESIDGFKNFLQTPTVKGKEILIDEELPYEAWFSGSEELKNIPNKARLRIGPEVMNVGQKLGRKMRSSPLIWNSGRWQAEIKRDCKLLVEGLARLQFGASSSGKYGYLVFYNDDAQKKSIGFVGGTGDAVNTLQWKHGLHFGRIFEAKAGTVFNITYEGEEGKKVDFAQINTLHIMEII